MRILILIILLILKVNIFANNLNYSVYVKYFFFSSECYNVEFNKETIKNGFGCENEGFVGNLLTNYIFINYSKNDDEIINEIKNKYKEKLKENNSVQKIKDISNGKRIKISDGKKYIDIVLSLPLNEKSKIIHYENSDKKILIEEISKNNNFTKYSYESIFGFKRDFVGEVQIDKNNELDYIFFQDKRGKIIISKKEFFEIIKEIFK